MFVVVPDDCTLVDIHDIGNVGVAFLPGNLVHAHGLGSRHGGQQVVGLFLEDGPVDPIHHLVVETEEPTSLGIGGNGGKPVHLFGKAEWYNPGGSVKDRAAASIVTEARRSGKLAPGKILLDSTSGNMGIAYTTFGAAMDVPVTLVLPANASPERIAILKALGVFGKYSFTMDKFQCCGDKSCRVRFERRK